MYIKKKRFAHTQGGSPCPACVNTRHGDAFKANLTEELQNILQNHRVLPSTSFFQSIQYGIRSGLSQTVWDKWRLDWTVRGFLASGQFCQVVGSCVLFDLNTFPPILFHINASLPVLFDVNASLPIFPRTV